MNQVEARDTGIANGYVCAKVNYEEGMTAERLIEVAVDAEDNGRQFTPFEFFAQAINEKGDSADAIWNAYDRGVIIGINRFAKENRVR